MLLLMHFFPATCLLAVPALALPNPQAVFDALPPPGPIVNVTSTDLINGTVSIMTSLRIGDDSGCNDDQKTQINQAYIDALNIVGTVGGHNGPGHLYADTQVPPWDYFGPFAKTTNDQASQIMNNFFRAQAPNSEFKVGDWWYDRYFDVFCNDPGDKEGHSCQKQGDAPGYEVEPSFRNDNGNYPLINFCTSFWNLESLAKRVEQVEARDFGFDKNDVRSLVSQGSAFLREMFHTSATEYGVSSPRCQDVKVTGYPGKACGPSRAKQLARMELGGPTATSVNVDNYVFYSISWYMYSKWKIIPKLPRYSWPQISNLIGPDDDAEWDADDQDDDSVIASGGILDDANFYAGSGYTPDGGNQPAGPMGPSSDTETILMITSVSNAPPTSLTRRALCDCNEDGCTPASPACCANGTCPPCDCNENGCTPASPACCANGTC